MTGFRHLFTSSVGVTHAMRRNDNGTISIASSQDTTALIDRAKAMATHNDGWSPSRELRRVATIPAVLRLKWLNEEGWDAFDAACADKLKAKLNDPDFLYLRTAPGRL